MALLTAQRESQSAPIRPFRLTRDLRALADLMEVCFADELDRTNNQIVREMRDMAGWGLMLRAIDLFGAPYRGFVWEEQGRVLGNVSLARERDGIWSISNVAVRPDARGRGIAGALMDAALARLRRDGAQLLTLQASPANEIALGLYQRRGFAAFDRVHELMLRGTHIADTIATSVPAFQIRRPRTQDRDAMQHILFDGLPSSAERVTRLEWRSWQASTGSGLRAGLMLSLQGNLRVSLVALAEGAPVGLAWADVRMLGTGHDVGLASTPGAPQGMESALLEGLFRAMEGLPARDLRATVSDRHPRALQALLDGGFEEVRVLDRMLLHLN